MDDARLSAPLRAWVETALGSGIGGVRGLRLGGMPWLLTLADGRRAVLRTGGPDDAAEAMRVTTEATALALAVTEGVPVPDLLAADPSGSDAGQPAILIGVVDGTSAIPVEPSPERLDQLGRAAGRLHRITIRPSGALPRRARPIEIEDFGRGRDGTPSAALLRSAEDSARDYLPAPVEVLLHGDLWQGNTLWSGDRLTALLDWDSAGVGHYGIDLSSLRLDAALMFAGGADEITVGWVSEYGAEPFDQPYFDVVAALATPADIGGWEANIQGQGRPDLTAPILTRRRDAFLSAALERLQDSEPGDRGR